MGDELWVVMPVYNEGSALEPVMHEWVAAVRAPCPDAVLCVVDDGSSDATATVLDRLAAELPMLRVLRQTNAGHGRACVTGYRAALTAGARWVLQVDSDGQCDPRHFGPMWEARRAAAAVFGHRRHRQDGAVRTVISRVLALVVYAATGVWVRDANSPYRLMRAEALAEALTRVREDVHLANVLLAVALQAGPGISWVEIGFRSRIRPAPLRPRYFVAQARRLWGDLRRHRRNETRRGGSSATRHS